MRKLRKAVVLAVALGGVGLLNAGTATADGGDGHGGNVLQSAHCRSHDLNVDVLGQVGVLNGALGNALNGEGSPAAQPRLLQRKCACGGTPGLTGECEECRKERLTVRRRATHPAGPSEVPPIVREVVRSPGRR